VIIYHIISYMVRLGRVLSSYS